MQKRGEGRSAWRLEHTRRAWLLNFLYAQGDGHQRASLEGPAVAEMKFV